VSESMPIHANLRSSRGSCLNTCAMMVMFTIAAVYAPTTADVDVECPLQTAAVSSHVGDVPLAVVRRGDPPPHSRGRHRCRWATSRNRCCVAHPSAEVPPVGPGVRHPP
jgi:hypothetical protein